MSARGEVRVNLTPTPGWDNEGADRRRLAVLDHCPDGVRVVIDIGERNWVTLDANHWLRANHDRLELVICGTDPRGVALFVQAARGQADREVA